MDVGTKKENFSLPKVARSFLPLSFFPFFLSFAFSLSLTKERESRHTNTQRKRTHCARKEREREKSKQTDIHEDASVFLLSRSSVNACIEKSERERSPEAAMVSRETPCTTNEIDTGNPWEKMGENAMLLPPRLKKEKPRCYSRTITILNKKTRDEGTVGDDTLEK